VVLIVVAVAVAAISTADAHSGHPQKKLFAGHWWRVDFGFSMNLTTADFFLDCDPGAPGSCATKWSTPAQAAVNDWNAQPMTVNLQQVGNQDPDNDIWIIVEDVALNSPNLLGVALFYNSSGNFCDPSTCTYYFGDALIGDNAHTGPYGGNDQRRGTTIHELGHLINLRHESVNANESQLYPCGSDDTGTIPHSVMAYNCIDPPSVQTIPGFFGLNENYVHPWDTCGVNHKYFDAAFGFAGCGGIDADMDGIDDAADNCPSIFNPTQSNVDLDSPGDACDPDIDGDGLPNGSDPDADGDKVNNTDESNCGGYPLDGSLRPERIDGPFAGVSDDGDAQIDEPLPPGAGAYDCDGDGYTGTTEASITTSDRDACGSDGWPNELANGDNRLNVADINSFLFPLGTNDGHGAFAYFGHTVPDAGRVNEERWNLDIAGAGAGLITIADLNALNPGVNAPTSRPPMFGGLPAFFTNVGQCPWPP
jgi:hypothetical protein